MTRAPLLQGGALVLALAAVAVLSVLKQEREQPSSDTYSTYDARRGGFLAWYDLLAREGAKVGRFEERAAFLDHNVGLLVVGDPPASPSGIMDVAPADVGSLAAWVRGGGRLLVVGSGYFGGLASREVGLAPAAVRARAVAAIVAPALRGLGVRTFAAGGELRLRSRKPDRVLLRDRRGVLAIRYALGRGQVVQVADGTMFRNGGIGRADHARLAYALVAVLGGARPFVSFDEALHGYVTPEHWWHVLPRRFVVALILACLVLGVAMAGAGARLGPARPAEPERAPDTTEYLDALATLMQRAQGAGASLQQALVSTRRLVAARLGVADDVPVARMAARIEQPELRDALLDLDAFAARGTATDATLVRGLALAYRLREEYRVSGR